MSENSKRDELKKLKIIKRMEELRGKGFSEKKIKRFIELDDLSERKKVKESSKYLEEQKKRKEEYQKQYYLKNIEDIKKRKRSISLKEKSLSTEERTITSLKVKQKLQPLENPLLEYELSQWICSGCVRIKKSNNKKSIYHKNGFICSKCEEKKYFGQN